MFTPSGRPFHGIAAPVPSRPSGDELVSENSNSVLLAADGDADEEWIHPEPMGCNLVDLTDLPYAPPVSWR